MIIERSFFEFLFPFNIDLEEFTGFSPHKKLFFNHSEAFQQCPHNFR